MKILVDLLLLPLKVIQLAVKVRNLLAESLLQDWVIAV